MAARRRDTIDFLVKYKELECLWKMSDENYNNKFKRLSAMHHLLKILQRTDGAANFDTVARKINSLRSSFNRERNKVNLSYRSGISADDIHVPKLWYYDMLTFLSDTDTESTGPGETDSKLTETVITESSETMDTELKPDSLKFRRNASSNQLSQHSFNINTFLKRSNKNSASEILTNISNRLDSPKSKIKQQYSVFGEQIAEKLRAMPTNMALHCQKIINDAIYQADVGNLNYTSRIVTDYISNVHSQS